MTTKDSITYDMWSNVHIFSILNNYTSHVHACIILHNKIYFLLLFIVGPTLPHIEFILGHKF